MKKIRYLSNPCNWSKNERHAEFVYEGGSHLFHFCASSCIKIKEFECYIPINTLFFANDEFHAADILKRMLYFRLTCKQQNNYSNPEYVQLILDNEKSWEFNLVPKNQFYKVGWADYDNFL